MKRILIFLLLGILCASSAWALTATVIDYGRYSLPAGTEDGQLAVWDTTTNQPVWESAPSVDGDDLGSATATDIIDLFASGSCSGYLKSDGTCDTPGAAHDALTLGDAAIQAILDLSSQALTLDSQTANYFMAGPTSGGAADPTFRAMVADDLGTTLAPQFARIGAGVAADATNPITSTGFSVDADGDVTAKSVTVSKVSGYAGDLGLYEANSTDTHGAGFRGPASITGDAAYRGIFPNAKATSDNMVMAWDTTGESGSGTATDPYLQAMKWIDLDNYVLQSAVPWQRDIHVPAPAATDVVRFRTTKAITLSAIGCLADPDGSGESVVVDIAECNGDGDSCNSILSSTVTCANTNTTATITDTAIAANVWVLVDLGTVTGTVSDLSIYLRGTEAQ